MDEQETQPQAEETPVTEQPEEETPQVVEPTVETPPGAETEAPKEPERAFTQTEVSAIQSASDKEVAQYRQALAQQAMRAEYERKVAAEMQAQVQDRRAVEEGEITESGADQRRKARQQEAYRQQVRREETTSYQRMMQHGEEMGRVMAAQDFAKQYSVEASELLGDKSLKSPEAMEAKAAKLQNKRLKAELKAAQQPKETFDKGQMGGAGANLSDMAPKERKQERERRLLSGKK